MSDNRKKIPTAVRQAVLVEAGYRCGVPTCRTILAIDLHHLLEISNDGLDDQANLICVCPTCHALYHRGVIPKEALFAWKGTLIALNAAFDNDAVDKLLFLSLIPVDYLIVSGDGLLNYSRLIAADLARVDMKANNGFQLVTYAVNISDKGRKLIEAWKSGNRAQVADALQPDAAG